MSSRKLRWKTLLQLVLNKNSLQCKKLILNNSPTVITLRSCYKLPIKEFQVHKSTSLMGDLYLAWSFWRSINCSNTSVHITASNWKSFIFSSLATASSVAWKQASLMYNNECRNLMSHDLMVRNTSLLQYHHETRGPILVQWVKKMKPEKSIGALKISTDRVKWSHINIRAEEPCFGQNQLQY